MSESSSTHPLRVLVVDDCPDTTESLRILLGLWGHEVRAAHSGAEALRLAPGFLPDIILLDIGLPGLDGYEVAGRLRQVPDLAGVFLLALTGYSREQDVARSRAAGFDMHLVKPFDPDALRLLLQSRAAEPAC
jgi:two-component system CheB/CheR fusion protein